MTILVAPDSFKGTYTAEQVAAAVAEGLAAGGEAAVRLPVADGGEGTYAALCRGMRRARSRSRRSIPGAPPPRRRSD